MHKRAQSEVDSSKKNVSRMLMIENNKRRFDGIRNEFNGDKKKLKKFGCCDWQQN